MDVDMNRSKQKGKKALVVPIVLILIVAGAFLSSGCIEEDHEEHQTDPHIWMSPRNAEKMIDNFLQTFEEVREEAHEKVRVAVSIPPQREWVKETGDDDVEVVVMVPPGEDPHTHEPTASQMQELSDAHLYFKIGAGLEFEERWMDEMKEQNPDMEIVDGSEGIDLLHYDEEHDHDHDHDEHDIRSETTDQNEEDYRSLLSELHDNLSQSFEPYEGRKFLIYHPSMGYFAEEYGLEEIAVEAEGKEPGPRDIENIIEEAKEEDVSVVFISPQFDEDQAESIAEEIDAEVMELDPLAEDYLDNIEKIAEDLIYAFEKD